jgi:rubrerythrin
MGKFDRRWREWRLISGKWSKTRRHAPTPKEPSSTMARRRQRSSQRWVDFTAAGATASGEFRCAECGYGVVVQQVLPPCPMCQATVWERREPFAARFAD